jgi:hypothetical protein
MEALLDVVFGWKVVGLVGDHVAGWRWVTLQNSGKSVFFNDRKN